MVKEVGKGNGASNMFGMKTKFQLSVRADNGFLPVEQEIIALNKTVSYPTTGRWYSAA